MPGEADNLRYRCRRAFGITDKTTTIPIVIASRTFNVTSSITTSKRARRLAEKRKRLAEKRKHRLPSC